MVCMVLHAYACGEYRHGVANLRELGATRRFSLTGSRAERYGPPRRGVTPTRSARMRAGFRECHVTATRISGYGRQFNGVGMCATYFKQPYAFVVRRDILGFLAGLSRAHSLHFLDNLAYEHNAIGVHLDQSFVRNAYTIKPTSTSTTTPAMSRYFTVSRRPVQAVRQR
jgi:hypothetical protein